MSKKTEISFPTEKIKEGKIEVIVPKLNAYKSKASDYAPSKAPVFCNPIMELNRDFTILAVKSFQKIIKKDIVFCEPLASSGIRCVRLAAEVPHIKKIILGDINSNAIKLSIINVKLNGFDNIIKIHNKDANLLLSQYGAPKKRLDVIDIDPFGSPVLYFDTALRALCNNGMLAITATDLAPLCGVHPKACIRKYGGKPLRTEYCQEIAIRILSGCIIATAAKYDIGTRLLFSYSSDHYLRVYVQIKYGAKEADKSIASIGYLIHCFGCFYRESVKYPFSKKIERCPKCGSKLDWSGPLWLGKISNKEFCQMMEEENKYKAFKNNRKIRKFLSLLKAEEEGPITYFVVDKICDKLGLPVPSVFKIIQKLQDDGFTALPTHFNPRGIRTNAQASKVTNLIKKYALKQVNNKK